MSRQEQIRWTEELRQHAFKISDYHREMVAIYYARLVKRFGIEATLRRIPAIKRIIWTPHGLDILIRH
jgi:hypothetical protein